MGLTILLVEDNGADAQMVARAFRRQGTSEITIVTTLRGAQAALAAGPFDAVLADLGLPDAHGLEVVHRLLPFCTDTPIVVLSGMDDPQLALGVVDAGAADFLVKGSLADLAKLPPRVYQTLAPARSS